MGNGDTTEQAAELKDDAAALAFAYEIISERMQNPGQAHLNSQVIVRDEARPIVFSIPFLAASA
jgi:hypothetical protein